MPKLFLDCDGVLADFDAGARDVLGGMTPAQFEERHGKREFWRRLANTPDFYGTLPLMPDAQKLFDAVAHLRPTILTGLPLGTWAAPQKVAWAERHFPGTPIITCMARDKVSLHGSRATCWSTTARTIATNGRMLAASSSITQDMRRAQPRARYAHILSGRSGSPAD